MLGLPSSTEVNRRVPKEKLYTNAIITPRLRDLIKTQIEAIIWCNKLSQTTIGIAEGYNVKEIQVFEIKLRQRELDKGLLTVITKAIPYKILFVLTYDSKAQAWMETSGTFYNTEWYPLENLKLRFEGLNLVSVYDNLMRQISGGRLDTDEDIAKAVELDRQRQKLEREIAILEKLIRCENQFNKQVELNERLKKLRKELSSICK
jgi:hypothetical protein